MPVKRAAASTIRARSSGSFTHQTNGFAEGAAAARDLIQVAAATAACRA